MTNYSQNPFSPSFQSDDFLPDKLIAGDLKLVTTPITLAHSAALVRGTVLGRVTATGKYLESLTAAVDGSQNAVAILADDCDASAADALGGAYLMGEFNGDALTLGTGWTLAAVTAALRAVGIFIKTAVPADDPS